MGGEKQLSFKSIIKFILISLVGVVTFLVPVQVDGSSTTVVSLLTTAVGRLLSPCMKYIVIGLIAASAFGSLYDYICTKAGRPVKAWIHERFSTGVVYIITKFLTLAFVVMCSFAIGPQEVRDTAQSMVDLGSTLVSLALALSFLLVFLTDGGLMEFIGVIMKPIVRPLFKVPSDASLDLLASWVGASDAAAVLSSQKFLRGDYTKREAANVMCNFSLVSVSFCMVVAEVARVGEYFVQMYLLLAVLGILLATILPRLYPLNKLEDVYVAQRPAEPVTDEKDGLLHRAFISGCAVAERFDLKKVWVSGLGTVSSVLLNVMPVGIGWGVIGMFVVGYTPVFEWLSLPMGWFLDILGVESAYAIAPATLVGFIDMYIPALLITGIESVQSRFIIATLSLIQIVYITIVGAVVMQCKLGLDPKKLFLIFMERTIIALPLIVLAAHFIIPG